MNIAKHTRLRRMLGLTGLLALASGRPVQAHPMGNFSISHYTRIEAQTDRVALRYVLDFAEIPTVSLRSAMDTNRDGQISEAERDAYLRAQAPLLRDGLHLTVNDKPVALNVTPVSLQFRSGAGGLNTTRLTLDLSAALPQENAPVRIGYKDSNFEERTGWKEIVATAGTAASLQNSSVPTTDQSQELTAYPTAPGFSPPQMSEATFSVASGQGAGAAPPQNRAANPGAQPATSNTPQDAFTQTIAHKTLTPGIILLSLCMAFIFGAFHALSPGHGKAMVAAYLVGARGTAKHAVFLGAVVTLTHTIGVFALGLLTLFASQYIVPERLYPVLSALSGVMIVVIGVTLLRQRLAALTSSRSAFAFAGHDHDHEHTHDHSHDHGHTHPHTHDHDHDHDHHHDHAHSHDHSHAHADGNVLYHDHGDGHYHSHHIPEETPLSLKSLLVLGITGGALPCPSALVVMLSAIALHRVAFGLALITSFSLGLAAVLTGIGILVVHARGFLEKLPLTGRLATRLPVVSAALVTLIGLVLVARSVSGGF